MSCVCGKGPTTEECCGRYVSGKSKPQTAEDLMRSRYAAFALGEIGHIMGTHHPSTVEEIDRDGVESWSRKADWHGLEILGTEKGGPEDDEGIVEFIARYTINGFKQAHHERAEFKKEKGRWYYVDGKQFTTEPVVRAEPRVGRNDPCPCGSGKKYKKCCGKAA